MTVERWIRKAGAMAAGWPDRLGVVMNQRGLILALAVAEHETRCGDAWPGEFNWGALQRPDGRLTKEEEEILIEHGIPLKPVNEGITQRARDVLPGREGGALHRDSSPITGWYHMYFYKCANDEEGASLFLKVLASKAPRKKVLLDLNGTPLQMATSQYDTGYFQGFHDPRQPGGREANIADYAKALNQIVPQITVALAGDAGVPLDTVADLQIALTKAGFDPGSIDGIMGKRTRTAIAAFQKREGLTADGIAGPITKGRLRELLGK